jgi:hypothetical protein
MIATKIMVFFLIFAILIVLREIFDFVIKVITSGKYEPGKKRLILAAVAISYIFTIIFTGFKL